MKVGIIGAGFTGLSAGYQLSKLGHSVTIFEKEEKPGGLAIGFSEPRWEWPLEKHYHHWFSSDWAVRNLAKEIGQKIEFKRPITSVFIDGELIQLDSAFSLLQFNKLSFIERLRTGAVLAYLRLVPNWKPLESVTAEKFLKKYMGENSWEILWKPLFEKKFSKHANEIPASWFWARIKKRSPSLGYPDGGFEGYAERIDESIHRYKGNIIYNAVVKEIRSSDGKIIVKTDKKYKFDRVVCTLPSPIFIKITRGLSNKYQENLLRLKGIGAVNLLLSLKKQFLVDGTYWLNINELEFPFLAVVEQTNFVDKSHYNDEYLVYVGNYLPHDHEYYKKEAEDLVKEFLPYLKKINSDFSNAWINKAHLFKTPFAQPVIPLDYSKILPKLETPIKGLYLANIQQVYPWDRGTNYAVELGNEVANLIINC